MFDEETEDLLDDFIREFMEAVRDSRVIFHEGCVVVTAPTGALPEYITVTVDGINDFNIQWRGVPPVVNIGDVLIVWENTITHRREIFGASGALGVSLLHALLSATHSDTLPAAPVRGDLVVANATPLWSRLALSPQGFFVKSDGTDASWFRLAQHTCHVGPWPECETNQLGAAVGIVNAAGPPTAANPWVILVDAIVTIEAAGDITIPQYCHVVGRGEGSTIGLAAGARLILSSDSSLLNIVVKGSPGIALDVIYANNATNVVLRNVRSVNGTMADRCFHFTGSSTVKCYHCIAESTNTLATGFYVSGTADAYLQDCIADDPTNFAYGLALANSACAVESSSCVFYAATDDVGVLAAAHWIYCNDDFDYTNCTITGVAEPADGQPVVWFNYTINVATAAQLTAAINWIKGKSLIGTYTISAAAGSYDLAVVFEDIFTANDSRVVLQGDTRVLAGISYVDGAAMNQAGLANGGTGTCGLANAGNDITVTGTVANPDFDADGWGNGDTVLVLNNAGAVATYTVSATLNNVITLTVAAPAIGNDGTAIALIPNRAIARTAAGPCVTVDAARGIKLDGWYLDTATGALCFGIYVINSGFIAGENVLINAEDYGIYVNQHFGLVEIARGASSVWAASIGLTGIAGHFKNSYMVFVGCITAVLLSKFCYGDLAYGVAATCTTGFDARFHSALDCHDCTARAITGDEYYANRNAFLYAANTDANNSAPGVGNYNPAPAAIPGYGNGNGDANIYAS